MERETQTLIQKARVASQLILHKAVNAPLSDSEMPQTRLADYRQQPLLLLNRAQECGRQCNLELSDGTALEFSSGEPFNLEKMRALANQIVQIPQWWTKITEGSCLQALNSYWKYDRPLPAVIGADGKLTLPDGTDLPIRYDHDNGVAYALQEALKEKDETLFADW